jgi:hypothetical protein
MVLSLVSTDHAKESVPVEEVDNGLETRTI